ncbi:hypothetical protein K438DRAFT_1761738 [Mycena galopus ATCC 62051]|nr:hypothetical protein K438DRAFT_1761738 [Mycena galopus ATCC 62051]
MGLRSVRHRGVGGMVVYASFFLGLRVRDVGCAQVCTATKSTGRKGHWVACKLQVWGRARGIVPGSSSILSMGWSGERVMSPAPYLRQLRDAVTPPLLPRTTILSSPLLSVNMGAPLHPPRVDSGTSCRIHSKMLPPHYNYVCCGPPGAHVALYVDTVWVIASFDSGLGEVTWGGEGWRSAAGYGTRVVCISLWR